ncbi:MAG: acyl carrier protein [Bacteroidales bacterium]|nr:acyl carrier protein [Bacteroidales bacterium]
MNTKAQFLNILQAYVDFPTEEIPTDKPFKAVAGIDSFMLIELISSIEDNFGFSIPNKDLQQFKTINDIVGYIDSRRN